MSVNELFSYKNYKKIIEKYKCSNRDYLDCIKETEFSLLRHDVEFSMSRALLMAEIDHAFGVESTFLLQVKSDAYNLCSIENKKIVDAFYNLGRKVGLHLYVSHLKENDWKSLEYELKSQSDIFEAATGWPVERFSFHRPPKWVLQNRDDWMYGYLNLYGESFFELSERPTNIKYMADSRHDFSYGNPLDDHDFCKFQILLHPDEWSEKGYAEDENFETLEIEHDAFFKSTLNKETKNYGKYYKAKNP